MITTRTRRGTQLLALFVGLLAFVLVAGAPDAAPAIAEPTASPYQVTLDAQGKPAPFTIAVAGFPAGSLVYVEQCDPQPTSTPDWAPTRNCDIGTSPAPAIVDPNGRARFVAGDLNHSFQPFVGLGPQGLFSCLTPDAKSPKSGLPEYRSCQVRVSSNNNQSTADQVFLPIVFGSASAPSTSGSSSNAPAIRRGRRRRDRAGRRRDRTRESAAPQDRSLGLKPLQSERSAEAR